MTFVGVQKAADGSVCKAWHHCTESLQSEEKFSYILAIQVIL